MRDSMPYSDCVVLVVDDNSEEVRLIAAALAEQLTNIQIRSVLHGAEALETLKSIGKQTLPNVIIIDYHMPKMTAFEFLKQFGLLENVSKIPVIVWTGEADPSIVQECQRAGAHHVRLKPTNYDDYMSFALILKEFVSNQHSSRHVH
jgi:CheY-like chemotaxis protein